MDKIMLNGMSFYGYHGVFPEENKLGQRYKVDLQLYIDLKQAGQTDDLSHSVNYAEVYEVTKNIVEGPPYQLIESVAEKIATECLSQWFNVQEVVVTVTKPDPPIAGHYEAVAVEIGRKRP
ncbi:dihydroneopterin aldolase [Caldalkalibacillus salinus]|uniref:dihydroneopterin aldolase n=1 Tax=Caldalkalibacillus salinus TaxID=2803787 RepID=UPI0019213E15|nr:dihydroneopterin aldolase [Caldalkalibacillus salinus]